MRLILRGDELSARKYIGFAKARLNDMKNIMNALSIDYIKKYYKLPDAELVVESRYGLDSAWIVGKKKEEECSIDFVANIKTGNAPLTVNFRSIASHCTLINYLWSFGGLEYDGVDSSFSEVTHTYDTPGIYTVKLKAWDGGGISDTVPRTAGTNFRRTGDNLSPNLAAYNNFLATSEISEGGDVNGWYRIDTGVSTFEYSNKRVFKTAIMNNLDEDDIIVAYILVAGFIVKMEGIPALKESGDNIGRIQSSRLSQVSQIVISDISDYIGTNTEFELTDESFLQLSSPVSQGEDHGWNSDLILTRYPRGIYAEKEKINYITVT